MESELYPDDDDLSARLGVSRQEVDQHTTELRDLVFAWMRSRGVRTHELLAINLPVLLAMVLCLSARDPARVHELIREYVNNLRGTMLKLSAELEADPEFQKMVRERPGAPKPN